MGDADALDDLEEEDDINDVGGVEDYEMQRLLNIQANKAMLKSLGLLDLQPKRPTHARGGDGKQRVASRSVKEIITAVFEILT